MNNVSFLKPNKENLNLFLVFGIIFFSDYPDIYVITGSLVIVISTYYIIYRERKLGKKINLNKSSTRQI